MTKITMGDLPKLIAAIDREHHAAMGAARNALEHALACGRLLVKAKETVPHGKWALWVENHLSVSPRQASNYMRLARDFGSLSPGDRKRVQTAPPLRAARRARAARHVVR